MSRTITIASLTLTFATLALAHGAHAAVPDVVTYAGSLHQGAQPADGTFSAVFELFDAATAGTRLFTQTEPSLAVSGGELVVDLGNDPQNPLDDTLLASHPLFLSITVNGETLAPRVPFTSVPFARRAAKCEEADSVGGLSADDISNLYTAGAGLTKSGTQFSLASNAVSSENIVDGSVSAADLAAGSVTSTALAAGSVNGNALAAGAVTTSSIAAGAVTASALAPSSVNGQSLVNGSVTGADLAFATVALANLAPGSVDGSKIVDGTVTAADIANGNVGSSELANGAVTLGKIAAGAVRSNEISDLSIASNDLGSNSVTTAKIQDGAVTAAKVHGLDVFVARVGCGGGLMVRSAPNATLTCTTLVCGTHFNSYLTNNEDEADTFFNCNGSCTELNGPDTCNVTTSPIGVLVVQ